MKKVVWLGSSRSCIRNFAPQAQDIAGHELLKIQQEKMPADWRPMPIIGSGTIEIRVHHPYEHRVICIVNRAEAIYVLHCFKKKTQQTPLNDIKIARNEYAKLQKLRQ
jgi:phage-related protein